MSCADFPHTKRTTVNTTYTHSPLASHDPSRTTYISNCPLLLTASRTISYIHHVIELTGNRTLGVMLYCCIIEHLGKRPREATHSVYIALLAHTRTLLDHRSYRRFLSLHFMRACLLGMEWDDIDRGHGWLSIASWLQRIESPPRKANSSFSKQWSMQSFST